MSAPQQVEGRIAEAVRRISGAPDWDSRVAAIRRIPEEFGQRDHRAVFAAVADALYVPALTPQIAFVEWRPDYDAKRFEQAYQELVSGTSMFERVDVEDLAKLLRESPESLLALRTILGYTSGELAVAASELARGEVALPLSRSRIEALEHGRRPSVAFARLLAETVDRLISGSLWPPPPEGWGSKLEKFDTREGWTTVRELAAEGVPYSAYLHQRHYGGAFRQLLDATSSSRGDVLEGLIERRLTEAGIAFVRTGRADQGEIARRFNLTVSPAPDFVVYQPPDVLRAVIECKQANDGGTARDKAARFSKLRQEAARLGGIAVVAVIDGLGWRRSGDALGPIVQSCDGRVFTPKTVPAMLTVQPFPQLRKSGS